MEFNNVLVGDQGIKWAREGKEGIIALTAPDLEEKSTCEDNDCLFCSYYSVCKKEITLVN